MKKSIKIIGTIGAMTILLCGAYLLGATQAKVIKAEKEIIKTIEVIPDDYIPLDECIPLEDVAYCYINSDGYLCFELKDVGNQLDNPNNAGYTDIMERLEDVTGEYRNNFVDMQTVTDFEATENGLQLYLSDGSGYYWER